MTEETTQQDIYVQGLGRRGASWLQSKHNDWVLAAISFAESVFAPIIIDPFLIAVILAKPNHWVRYIVISIIFSVFGGVVAYFLGSLFFDVVGEKIIALFHLEHSFMQMTQSVDSTGFAFVLLGALTPIPYKLVAIASGLIHISFVTFFFASLFGRVLRLGLVGYAAHAVGPYALPVFRKNLLTMAYIFFFILIAYIIIRLFV